MYVIIKNIGIEKRSYYVLNEIVEAFKETFRNEGFSDSQILNALILNSMNMKKAFTFLKNPVKVNKSKLKTKLRNHFQSSWRLYNSELEKHW